MKWRRKRKVTVEVQGRRYTLAEGDTLSVRAEFDTSRSLGIAVDVSGHTEVPVTVVSVR